MADYICWVCRRKLKALLTGSNPIGWGKCTLCNKTREQREPPPQPKQQPLTRRLQEHP